MRCPWLIRHKLLLGSGMLLLIMALLAFSSFQGVYAYRRLARSISYHRARELRLISELSFNIGEMRSLLSRIRRQPDLTHFPNDALGLREDFRSRFRLVEETLEDYREQLEEFQRERCRGEPAGPPLREWRVIAQIEEALQEVAGQNPDDRWFLNKVRVESLDKALGELHTAVLRLPYLLQERMHEIAGEVRWHYRTWIILTWVSSALSLVVLALLIGFIYRSLLRPLKTLIRGSRQVAKARDFDHRIELDTGDEVAELAEAMNAMTAEFQRIRDDLDRQIRERDAQVRQRTKEVVRSEKMASLGLLAAGVAHEINNPLASIAWSAEALEMRLHDIMQQDDQLPDDQHNPEISVLRDYLRRIQDEAFRCKGITERLLDFSRLGDSERHCTDLAELVEGVIEMVRHLGRYRNKELVFNCDQAVLARVNAQEIKQVVLNLITNALDSIETTGTVWIRVEAVGGKAHLEFCDDGCGMTREVLHHLFEPFFTRRRDGQGTGLGLSIAYGIIQDHGGEITPSSPGPRCGSRFVVTLPLVTDEESQYETTAQAA